MIAGLAAALAVTGCGTLKSLRGALDAIPPTADALRGALADVAAESALTMAQARDTLAAVQDDIHLTITNTVVLAARMMDNADRITRQAEKTIAHARGETVEGEPLPWKWMVGMAGFVLAGLPFVFSRVTLPKIVIAGINWLSKKLKGKSNEKTPHPNPGRVGHPVRRSQVRPRRPVSKPRDRQRIATTRG